MKKVTEMTGEELKKNKGLITGIANILIIAVTFVSILSINQIKAGTKIITHPIFYFLIFLTIILALIVNNLMKIKKEIVKRKNK
ncbi:hypothetical protein ACFQ1R_12945 [Mariniflexile jejuense]|jgi:uncharacterized membrane protein YwzB|uniref:Uncharacterized protein n=1 Tax=Mariniflexile jejuense TaxID=1173582 RepID=A0ABW3JNB9_9FLAO